MKPSIFLTKYGLRRLLWPLAAVLALTAGGASHVFAQDDEDEEEDAITELIVVTGSRIQQRGDYVEPNPVVSLTADDLRNLGINNIADAMTTQIAQNLSNNQPNAVGQGSFFVGQTIANLRGLNPAFGSRTLTLVDGRRVVSTSNQADVVDLNIIPSNLLRRMDVVTGGASATYGSGAVAGVVNLMLDTDLEGVNLDLDYSTTEEGDGDNNHVSISAGTSLFDGRGHLLVGGEWQKQDPIRDCAGARDWCGRGLGIVTNNSGFGFIPGTPITPYPQYADQPHRFRTENLRRSQHSPNGVITVFNPNATQAWRFTDDGTDVEQYDLGIRGGAGPSGGGFFAPGGDVINGDGPVRHTNSTLTTGNERTTAFTYFEFDFNENLTGYLEGNYAKNEALNIQWPSMQYACVRLPGFDFFTFQPIPGNAYLDTLSPEAQAQLAIAATTLNPGAAFFGNAQDQGNSAQTQISCQNNANIFKDWSPQVMQDTVNESETLRSVMGLKGSLGDSWKWGAYYQWGKTESDATQHNVPTAWRYTFATDSILDPRPGSPTFNQPICRVDIEGVPTTNWYGDSLSIDPRLADGCRPLNPFGQNTADPEALAYAFREQVSKGATQLQVLALEASGEIWDGWGAGPLSSAVGIEMRIDEVDNEGSQSQSFERADFPFGWSDAFGGETTIFEEFIEFRMPLIADVPGIHYLDIGGGYRYAKYKNEGREGTAGQKGTQTTNNWKLTLNWEPLEWLGVRATTSRDLRAAGVRQLYIDQTAVQDSSTLGNPGQPIGNRWRPVTSSPAFAPETWDQYAMRTLGNPNLKPEESETDTVGIVVIGTGWAEGMRFSWDYIKTRIENGLSFTFGQSAEQCWEQSGNEEPEYQPALDQFGNPLPPDFFGNPAVEPVPGTGINGLFDPDNPFCQALHFGDPDPRDPGNPFSNILFIDQSYTNSDPFLTRSMDFAFDYTFGLGELPGNMFLRLTATRAIEASYIDAFDIPRDVAGQVGGGGFFAQVQPAPEWAGNFVLTYLNGPTTVTFSARYAGEGVIDASWAGPGEPGYQDANGNFLINSVDDNHVPSSTTYGLSTTYTTTAFGMRQLQLFGAINNLFDKDPPFSDGFQGGANPVLHDTLGRRYQVGLRMNF